MEISMNENIERLRNNCEADLINLAENLRKEGATDGKIKDAVNKHLHRKMKDFYEPKRLVKIDPKAIIGALADISPDSKAEGIFYERLRQNNISFKMHYVIGPYTADFLIGKNIVVEIDGNQHNTGKHKEHDRKRDIYMIKLGYKVIRIPLLTLMISPEGCIEAIREDIT